MVRVDLLNLLINKIVLGIIVILKHGMCRLVESVDKQSNARYHCYPSTWSV